MRSIIFNFRPEVPVEVQDALLKEINTWEGVVKAVHLKPNVKNLLLLRMCHAYISQEADSSTVIEHLSGLSEVESASLPSERRLLGEES